MRQIGSLENEVRILDIFTKYAGENLEELELIDVCPTERMLQQFNANFSQLKHLKWMYTGDQGIPVDLARACPKLESIEISACKWMLTNSGQFPQLKVFSTRMLEWSPAELPLQFLQNNVQLTELKISCSIFHGALFFFILSFSINLEVLNLQVGIWCGAVNIHLLAKYPKLKELTLTSWSKNESLFSELKTLSRCPQLNRLHLEYSIFERDSCPNNLPVDFEWPNLQVLTVWNYDLTEEEFTQILKMAPSLKELHIDGENAVILTLNEPILTRMVDIRKEQARISGTPVERLRLAFANFDYSKPGIHFNKLILAKIIEFRKRHTTKTITNSKVQIFVCENDSLYSPEIARLISIEFHYFRKYFPLGTTPSRKFLSNFSNWREETKCHFGNTLIADM